MDLTPKSQGTQVSTSSRKCSDGNPRANNSTPKRKNTKKGQNPAPNKKSLKHTQQLFIDKYTDPNSKETYLNATQSYKAAHPKATTKTANVEGCKYLTNPKIMTVLEQELADAGMDSKVLANTLADLARGDRKTVHEQYDGKGKLITRSVTSTPPGVQVKAIDKILKATGHYDAAHSAVKIAERKELLKLIEKGRKRGTLPPARGEGD